MHISLCCFSAHLSTSGQNKIPQELPGLLRPLLFLRSEALSGGGSGARGACLFALLNLSDRPSDTSDGVTGVGDTSESGIYRLCGG